MEINTLIIGYVPLTEMANRKAKELRDNSYYKDLISKYDLGNLYYSNQTPANWSHTILPAFQIDNLSRSHTFSKYNLEQSNYNR